MNENLQSTEVDHSVNKRITEDVKQDSGGVYRVITPGTRKNSDSLFKSTEKTDTGAPQKTGTIQDVQKVYRSSLSSGTQNAQSASVNTSGSTKGSTYSSAVNDSKGAAPGSLYKSTLTGTGSTLQGASRATTGNAAARPASAASSGAAGRTVKPIAGGSGNGGGNGTGGKGNSSGGINPFKRIGISALSALVFGVIAAVVFLGVTNFGMSKIGGKAEPAPSVEAQEEEEEAKPEVTLIPTIQADEVTEEEQAKPASGSDFTTAALDGRETLTTTEVVEQSMPAMVSITGMSVQQIQSFFGTEEYEAGVAGTGIIVGKTDDELLIATNNHIVEGTKDITVTFVDEKSVAALVKGVDASEDLAIVAVPLADIEEDTLNTISIIQMGDSAELKAGEEVVAIGNALGYGQTVSKGIVSAANRVSNIDGMDKTLIQTDAAINPGNSGGALINMKGELIGINEAKDVATEVEGVGYAIPISIAKPILEELMTGETRIKVSEDEAGYIGIASSYAIDQDRAQANNAPEGVYVEYLIEGGAAAEAGIRPGDIITMVNDKKVRSMDELKEELSYYRSGETVTITLYRYGEKSYEEMTFDVTLKGVESLENGVVEDSEEESEPEEGIEEAPQEAEPQEEYDPEYEEGPEEDMEPGEGQAPDIEEFFGDDNNSQGGFPYGGLFRYFFGR